MVPVAEDETVYRRPAFVLSKPYSDTSGEPEYAAAAMYLPVESAPSDVTATPS